MRTQAIIYFIPKGSERGRERDTHTHRQKMQLTGNKSLVAAEGIFPHGIQRSHDEENKSYNRFRERERERENVLLVMPFQ